MDIFKNFNDRRYAGALKQSQQPSKSTDCTSLSSNNSTASSDDLESEDSINDTSRPTSDHGSTNFKLEDMLEKKELRGKSTHAQRYFNGLVKDAANAAKLWKFPPASMSDIPEKKKRKFFEVMEEYMGHKLTCNLRKKLYKRLGEHLMNRRKYLKDLNLGKRTKVQKKRKHDEVDHDETAFDGEFEAGEEINVMSKNAASGQIVGKGIYISKKNNLFSNVVLKKIMINNAVDLQPALEDVGVKQMFTIKTSYLRSKEKEKKCKQNKHAKVKAKDVLSSDSDDDLERSTSESNTANLETDSEQASDNFGDDQHTTDSTTSNGGGSKNSKLKRRSRVQSHIGDFDTHNYRSLCLIEWENKNVYWGVKCSSITDITVQSSQKPCGRVGVDHDTCAEQITEKLATSEMKLNKKDVEVNPNMGYCVWELAKSNKYLYVSVDGVIKLKSDFKKEFVAALSKKIKEYTDK
ncbi:uncharacterized protein MAL13P1.304-like [Argopecten irradians]|uniref:uncharacterized protein MAL13P1.304-like n=1 Tax=Argopecten irradians TaxID=31199 RepID=UPI00371EDE55